MTKSIFDQFCKAMDKFEGKIIIPYFFDKKTMEDLLGRKLSKEEFEILCDKIPDELADQISEIVHSEAVDILNENRS